MHWNCYLGNQNVPKYTFYLKSDDEDKYSVQFGQLYECEPSGDSCSKIGTSNIALSSLSWAFSDPVENNQVISFNITSGSYNSGNSFDSLVYVNNINKTGGKF